MRSFAIAFCLPAVLLAASASASWTVIKLHPASSEASAALGGYGQQQVGWAGPWYSPSARLWSGSSASWVDINPAGAYQSQAYAAHSGRQVGVAHMGVGEHASLWSGTAQSWVSLNP